jgi:RHS repeat-associated protein
MYLLDGTGATVAAYEYDPYGNILSATGEMAEINPLRYRGYYYDAELEMYYLQSRYYDPQVGRLINADCYMSTGQGMIGNNMFAYCNNDPTNESDPTGCCSKFFLWKRDCGNTTCPRSRAYIKPRVAVIYDSGTSGILWGWLLGKGFKHQGSELIKRLSASYNVEEYPFYTMGGFVDCWNALNGDYQEIYILAHGWPGGLSCAGESIGTEGEAYSFSELNQAYTKHVYLYCCDGASLDSYGCSSAHHFANLTNAPVRAVFGGKMNFSWYGCFPKAVDGGIWVTVTPGYPARIRFHL